MIKAKPGRRRLTDNDVEIFWSYVDKRGSDECWEWLAHRRVKGYGSIYFRGKNVTAHRLSFWLTNGYLPKDKCVLHRCDNPPCCNPAHLFLGTPRDNVLDCIAKGRLNRPRGERQPKSKLKDEQVRAIRISGVNRERGFILETSKRYGVCQATIGAIVRGESWEHIKI